MVCVCSGGLAGSLVPTGCTWPSRAFPIAVEPLILRPQVDFGWTVGAGHLQPYPATAFPGDPGCRYMGQG